MPMRAPALLARCLPGLVPQDRASASHSISSIPDKDIHLPSPAVEILPSKAAHSDKDSGENIDHFKAEKVDSTRMLIAEGGMKDQFACNNISANATFKNNSKAECALIAKNSNMKLKKLQIFIASKEKALSQTALNALKQKRNALGTNRERVEQMEAHLKKDILIETERYGKKILVTDELPDG